MKLSIKALFLPIFIIIAATMIASVALTTKIAHADDEVIKLEEITVLTHPEDVYSSYGKGEKELTVTLSKEVTCRYQWYRIPEGSDQAVEVSSGVGRDIVHKVSFATDSGVYFCRITELSYGNTVLATDITTNQATVTILPKPITVITPTDKKYVYNGAWQNFVFYANPNEIEEGDSVSIIPVCDKATINAGVYDVSLKLDAGSANYTINGPTLVQVTVERAKLDVTIEDAVLNVDQAHTPVVKYSGFIGNDDSTVFGDNLPVAQEVSYKYPGIYNVAPSGVTQVDNYDVFYKPGKIYVNYDILPANQLSGIDGMLLGSFSADTKASITESSIEPSEIGFHLLKPINTTYSVNVNGNLAGETYTISINNVDASAFGLAVCYVTEDMETKTIEGFKLKDGTLNITLPVEDVNGYVVIYNEYTLITAIAAVIVLALFITFIALAVDRRRYRKRKAYRDAVVAEANRFR